jgi:hypothetical protein
MDSKQNFYVLSKEDFASVCFFKNYSTSHA